MLICMYSLKEWSVYWNREENTFLNNNFLLSYANVLNTILQNMQYTCIQYAWGTWLLVVSFICFFFFLMNTEAGYDILVT